MGVLSQLLKRKEKCQTCNIVVFDEWESKHLFTNGIGEQLEVCGDCLESMTEREGIEYTEDEINGMIKADCKRCDKYGY